jgi:hypothetical protein
MTADAEVCASGGPGDGDHADGDERPHNPPAAPRLLQLRRVCHARLLAWRFKEDMDAPP